LKDNYRHSRARFFDELDLLMAYKEDWHGIAWNGMALIMIIALASPTHC
jgi:hypothetical protein